MRIWISFLLILGFFCASSAALCQSVTINGQTFGPPWSFVANGIPMPPTCNFLPVGTYVGPYPTISSAIQSFFVQTRSCGPGDGPPAGSCFSLYEDVTANQVFNYASENNAATGCTYSYILIQGTSYPYDPTKNDGDDSCQCAGDPINLQTGNEYREDSDFELGALSVRRYYNSDAVSANGSLGYHWRNSFDRELAFVPASGFNEENYQYYPSGIVTLVRADGKQLTFNEQLNDSWLSDSDVASTLTEQTDGSSAASGWTFFDASTRNTEQYDAYGDLISITDPNGQTTTITYAGSTISTVTDSHGRKLTFNYTNLGFTYPIPNATLNNNSGVSNQALTSITLPDGGSITYAYDTSGRLIKVTYPDSSYKQYVYNESALTAGANLPYALTGDIDETNTRFTSMGYTTEGLATSSTLPSGVNQTQLTFNANSSTTATYALGNQATMGFTVTAGSIHTTSVSAECGAYCGQPNKAATYDANGYLSSHTDFNGNITDTTYAADGLLENEVDASGTTSQRTTVFTWNSALRVPLTRVVENASGTPVSSTQWVYNTVGQPLARCDIDPTNSAASGYACSNSGTVPAGVRRQTYTYCTAVNGTQCPITGLLLSVTGPRTDLTQASTYAYYLTNSAVNCGTPGAACYQAGDLHTITDALGHVTTIASYDADGHVTRTTDANGVNTDTTYFPRGWIKTRVVGGATTSFTYTAYGAVQTITDPDNVTVTYGYDTAHRLTKMTDALGNYIVYTLDAAGDKIGEHVYASTGTVHKSLTRTFNTLGQLTTVMDGLNNTVFNASASGSYDANGNLVQSGDGLGFQRQSGYDALNRLKQTIDNYEGTGTTENTTITYTRDSLDRLTQVTDPSSLNTTYSYNGLNDATGQVSPDTGTTSRTFDAGGDVLTRTDAKGIVTTNTYDALDRLKTTSYPVTTQNVTYSYDDPNATTKCTTSDPIGRLTRIIESTVTTVYCYDPRGNVIEKQQILSSTTDTTGYSITAAGRLSGIIYPSGTLVSYTRDGDGRIQSVSVTPTKGAVSTAVSGVTYQPFGPVSGYSLGNGQSVVRTYDANYRLTDLTSPAFNLHVTRDVMGDVTAIGNASGATPATETYGYDPLYRLLSVTEANGSVLESATYNQTGDRLTKTGTGLDAGTYTYNTNTHQLKTVGSNAFTTDADGNMTAMTQAGSTYGFGYSDRNRMTVAQLGSTTIGTYTYNAIGQRIEKVTSATERYDYNEASQMLGEYGADTRDYIWLGSIPVANVDTSGTTSTIAYVTADQLGTPRAIANSSGTIEWSLPYQGNPWSEVAPTSTGYVYNLRLPGQYFDAETSLSNNFNRDYYSSTGRYIQSDPIGLKGGSNTYGYASANPLRATDRLGLQEAPAEAYDDAVEEFPSIGPSIEAPAPTQYQMDMAQGECMAPGATPSALPQSLAPLPQLPDFLTPSEDFTTLFHGTGESSAADIVSNGVNLDQAAEQGGGDVFWSTTAQFDASWFAQANPAGENPAIVSLTIPNSTINTLTANGSLSINGSIYMFGPESINVLNQNATFQLVR